RKVQEERLVIVEGVQPVKRIVGEQVGGIASLRLLLFGTIDVKGRGIINPLIAEAHPLVKPWLRIAIFIAHMPFPEKARFVTFGLHVLGKEGEAFRQGCIVIYNGMRMGILPGKDRRPAW